ncbi:MAG: tryptophan 7-halogenase [Acidobacteriota bacterium]
MTPSTTVTPSTTTSSSTEPQTARSLQRDRYDTVVIGGGPAGAAAATLVAQAGHDVLLLEKAQFPRFKIGESLIPATYEILDRLDMLEPLKDSSFVKKYSVQFVSGRGKASAPFYFHETDPRPRSQTWQVKRADFDRMMLDNARSRGVEVHESVTVVDVPFEGDRALGVRARFADGVERDITARAVIDASGQRSLIARKRKLRRPDPCLRMAAFFTHYQGAQRDSGIDEGTTIVLHTENQDGWFWYIPLQDDTVSVGAVGPLSRLVKGRQGDPQQVFDEEVARCPGLVPRLEGATQTMPVKVLNDFSYRSTRIAGDGWVLAGDAYGFLDPMYSSGVLLALRSGAMAADAVIDGLAHDDLSAARLGAHEIDMRDGMQAFKRLIYAFYTPGFSFASFLKAHPVHRDAVVHILTGDVFDRDFSALFIDLNRFVAAMGWPPSAKDDGAGDKGDMAGAA